MSALLFPIGMIAAAGCFGAASHSWWVAGGIIALTIAIISIVDATGPEV